MNSKLTAKQLAAKGRNGDTMLVHMTPDEVAGLNYLALAANGKPLTINPETGLVEASLLKKVFKSILPTIIGAVLAPLTGGSSLAIAGLVGAGTGLVKKDWKAGLMAGLGAFGGANIGTKLAGLAKAPISAGQAAAATGDVGAANVLAPEALKVTGGTAADAAAAGFKVNAAGMGAAAPAASSALTPVTATPLSLVSAPQSGGIADLTGKDLLRIGAESQKAGPGGIAGIKANFGNMVQGAKMANPLAKGYVPGTLGRAVGISDAAMAFGPALGAIGAQTTEDASGEKFDPSVYMTNYSQGQVNPNFGQPGESYFINPGYTGGRWEEEYPGMPGKAAGGPIGGLGDLPEAGSDIQQYIRSLNMENTPRLMYDQATAPTNPTDPYTNAYNAAVRQRLNQQLGVELTQRPYQPPAPPPVTPAPQAPTPSPSTPQRPRSIFDRPQSVFEKRQEWKDKEAAKKEADTFRYTYRPGGGFTQTSGPTKKAAGGGIGALPEASRYIQGGGDGVSDSVPAVINGKQPARLADGEYVLDARTVSEIGNGSSAAGAKKLSQMVAKVHSARAKAKRGKPSGADRHLPT
jgi:hypothetical protein